MHFSKPLLVIIAGLAAKAAADKCHTKDDSIGRTCIFSDRTHWESLVNYYCAMYDPGRVVPAGSSTGGKMLVPDGFGNHQYFWGNHQIDRGDGGPDHFITFKECHDDMMKIWDKCPERMGGWVDTSFGATFAECIRI